MSFWFRRCTARVIYVVGFFLVVFFLLRSIENSFSGLDKNHATKNREGTKLSLEGWKKRTEVDLVVVEEHHEVLDYWFEAANNGIIPKSGNILLHIDGHSDMVPPEFNENYPLFTWPKDEVEIQAMMQSNDVFVQAAVISGLFKKVIWIWPSWDKDGHEKDDWSAPMYSGISVVTVNGEQMMKFCECEYRENDLTKKRCYYINRTAYSDDDYNGSEIDPKKCTIVRRTDYHELDEYNALSKLSSGELVKEGESLLLDIDEDFFGCVSRGQSLVDVGVPWVVVEEIDELLSEIFCPSVVQHEGLSDNLMQQILALIVKKCKKTKQITNDCVNPGHLAHKDFTSSLNEVLKPFNNEDIFCEIDEESREKKMSLLLNRLLRLELNQLKAFTDIGFCMQTSLRFYQPPGFQLCHGAIEPNSSVVTVHMPRENELNLRLSRLRRIVQAKNYPTPGMVTLCRSIRDGFTPVRYFRQIEKSVIESVLTSKPGVRYNVVYDENLLGGKEGWPSRQRKLNLLYGTYIYPP